jgi:hypothetical protein
MFPFFDFSLLYILNILLGLGLLDLANKNTEYPVKLAFQINYDAILV